MGAGMLLICNDKKIYQIADEHGVEAEEVGEVISEPKIIIKNRAHLQQESELTYEI
jgi:selenophosphate synthetase-related protein